MKGNSYLSTLLALLTLVSCGKPVSEIFGAPKTKSQVGIIASCTSKAYAQLLADDLGVQYRVINEKRKIIEFVGISEKALKEYLPKAKLKANEIFDDVLISSDFKAQASSTNYPFFGAHQRQERSSNAERYYPHLEQIEALSVNEQGEGVVIAVIDTGVYYNHPHLSPNIKVNNADRHGTSSDGRDNDGNGYADDYAGWDFYNGDAYPIDDNGHGTHVAGLAASTYMGVAPRAKILPVKVLSASGRGDLGTIAAGIMYAIDNGAHIINMSLGGSGASRASSEVQQIIRNIQVAKDRNVLVVSAAGNGGSDGIGDCNDITPVYPANIEEANMLSVASVDRWNNLTDYSNFGGSTVHVAAPGGDYFTGGLLSTALPDCNGTCSSNNVPYVQMMGTSMATPVVAGMAAVLKSKQMSNSYSKIKNALINSSVKESNLQDLVVAGGVVNLKQAFDSI